MLVRVTEASGLKIARQEAQQHNNEVKGGALPAAKPFISQYSAERSGSSFVFTLRDDRYIVLATLVKFKPQLLARCQTLLPDVLLRSEIEFSEREREKKNRI